MSVYADTSVFVSLYLQDAHTFEAQRYLADQRSLGLSPLHLIEWNHAVSRHIFQRMITAREAKQVFDRFKQDRESGLWEQLNLPDAVFETTVLLARKHVPVLGVRTLDTLHVASALTLGADYFWTFDERQSRLAEAAGLNLIRG